MVALFAKQIEMNIEYSASTELKDLQKAFNGYYPYLKLDFMPGNADLAAKTLQQINYSIGSGCLAITDDMTVAQLEDYFLNTLHLRVRVLRKSGNIWMQTTITNSWTLAHQNAQAREISPAPVF